MMMNDYVPSAFYLGQNYPNPFKDKTTIKYCVAYKSKVRVTVFDSEDKMIKRLVDEVKEAGTYEVEFDSCDLTAGTYYYLIEVGDYMNKKKMMLLK